MSEQKKGKFTDNVKVAALALVGLTALGGVLICVVRAWWWLIQTIF